MKTTPLFQDDFSSGSVFNLRFPLPEATTDHAVVTIVQRKRASGA